MGASDTIMTARPDQRSVSSPADEDLRGVALFFDVENILIGIQGELDVQVVTRLVAERGDVMISRAYADWGRYRRQQRQFLDEGVQMVFVPSYGQNDKNRTDTAICVDAMEVLYTRPLVDTFCIVSGDSDFGILAQRLRHHGKRVIGVSARSAASPVLVKQCHEFVFYEALIGQRIPGYSVEEGEGRLERALEHLADDVGVEFHASHLKARLRKQDPTFSERNYGAASFARFLANYEHLVTLSEGGLVRIAGAAPSPSAAPAGPSPAGPSEAARSGGPRLPALDAETLAKARGVLLRTVIEAARRHGGLGAVPLSRLKDTMQAVAPDFDEVGLGFKSFTHFLSAFPDVVVVERATNSARPNAGIVPDPAAAAVADGAGEPDDGRRSGPERRRRARKPSVPTAKQADAALADSTPKTVEAERVAKPQKEGEPELPLLDGRSRAPDASDHHA